MSGSKVVDVAAEPFEAHPSYKWVETDKPVVAGEWRLKEGELVEIPRSASPARQVTIRPEAGELMKILVDKGVLAVNDLPPNWRGLLNRP